MKSYDVVGYIYQAELVCLPCMRSIAAVQVEAHGRNSDQNQADDVCGRCGETLGWS